MLKRFSNALKVTVLGGVLALSGLVTQATATPYTENVPAPTSLPLPPEYPAAGGVAIVLTGINGNVYYQFSDPDGAFIGFQNRGTPRAFRGNPFTINDPIPLLCGFRTCDEYFGGQIARMDVRFSAYDGDTQPRGFDENDITLRMNGFDIGSWSGIQTEITNDSGTQSRGFTTGFGNNTFNTAWFSSENPALLQNILDNEQTTTQVFDRDPNDNYWDFTRGPSLPTEEVRTIAPGYELEKTVNGGATTYLQVGEVITYDYIVRNIGSVRIDNVEVVDDKIVGPVACNPTTLERTLTGNTAEEATCQATYTVTQEDVDLGTLTNIAVATGDPEYGSLGPLQATVTMTGPTLVSTMTLEKEASVAQFSTLDEVITYSFTVTNTGNSTLTDISVTDPKIPTLSCDFASIPPAVPPAAPAAINQGTCSGTYTVTQTDIDNFINSGTQLSNRADATATDPNGATVLAFDTVDLDGPAANPKIDLDKATLTQTFTAVGDVIPYTFTITNLGNVTWPNGPTLDDPLLTNEVCPTTAVAPMGAATCTGSHTITQDDLDAGEWFNEATASITVGGVTQTDTDNVTVTATLTTGLDIVKTLASGPDPFDAPLQELVYSYELTNRGNTRLSTFAVTDDKVAVTCPAVTIDPGDSVTCTSDPYVITQDDINAGSVTNTASGTGVTPLGATATSADTSLQVDADQNPALSMSKASDPDPVPAAFFAAGNEVDYVYTVTNSGNTTITDPITVTDDQITGPITCPVGPLLPTESVECRATYEITATDVLNGTVVNVASASDGNVTSNTDSVAIPQAGAPGITLDKVANTADFDDTSDVLSYTFTVTNSGETVISSAQPVTIADPLIGDFVCAPQPLNLNPTESFSCTATYGPVTQTDIDRGEVVNIASASFPFAGTTVTSPDATATVPANVTPALTLVKTALAADGGTQFDTLNEEIVYSFAVTNDSTQTLTTVVITDPLIPGFSCTINDLAPMTTDTTSCEARYTVQQKDLDSGVINNEATALGTSPLGVTAEDKATAQIAIDPLAATQILAIDKTADVSEFSAVGDIITYAIEVRNEGNLTLTNVAISDPTLGLSCTIGTLAPMTGDDSCTGTHSIVQADIDAGSFFNEATATADGGISEKDDVTVNAINRTEGLTFTKVADGPYSAVGDTVTFTLSVKNDGNTTLTGVVVTDDFFDPDLTCNIGSILPGATDSSCVGTYLIGQGDIDAGEITNTAQVNANGIDGDPLPQEDATAVVEGPDENPSIAVTKVEADGNGAFGAVNTTERFTFSVENTGNVTLTNVIVSDATAHVIGDPSTPFSCTIPTLAPGVTQTTCPAGGNLEADVTITQAMIDTGALTNTATAIGTPPSEPAVDSSASVTLAGPDQLPALTIAKSSVGAATFDSVGDTLDYEYVVTNSGNITLTAPITVADDKTTVTCPALPAAGLAPMTSITCTATYAVDQDDLDTGNATNIADATIVQPVVPSVTHPTGVAEVTSPTDTVSVTATQLPAIEIAKAIASTSASTYSATTDTLTFEFTVTNTGNVTLKNAITVTDIEIPQVLTCPASGAVDIAPGGSVTCTADWSPDQTDIDNGEFVNSATATVDFNNTAVNTDPLNPATATAVAVQTPTMEVAKTVAAVREPTPAPPAATVPAPFAPGKVVDYIYVISNTGNTTLKGPLTITDNLIPSVSCAAGDVAPGGTLNCTGSYTLTNDDVEIGSVTNIASAEDANGVVSPPTSAQIPGDVDAALEITKATTATTFNEVGQPIVYTYTVRNTSPGTVLPSGAVVRPSFVNPIIVTDDRILDAAGNPEPIDCTPTDGVLDPFTPANNEFSTCTATYLVTQDDLDAVQSDGAGGFTSAFVTNNATAATTFGTAQVVSAPASVTVDGSAEPLLEVAKTVIAGPTEARAGDDLTYQITTTNTGNQTVNSITVTDDMVGALECRIGGTVSASPFTLAPTEAVVCVGDYTVTQDDFDDQDLPNVADIVGASPDGTPLILKAPYSHPLFMGEPAVSIVKTLSDGEPDAAFSAVGQEIEFTMTVRNSGTITLTSVDVTDSLVPGICEIRTPLAPGDTDDSCRFIYKVTQDDLNNGSITNTGTAEAQPATPGSPKVTGTDDITGQGPEFEPSIAVSKTADLTSFDAVNTTITYTYIISNNGNVTVLKAPDTLTLSDDKIDDADLVCPAVPAAGLLPGASLTCTGTYETTQPDLDYGGITNVATIAAPNPYDPASPLGDTDTVTVPSVRTPDFTVEKSSDVTADVAAGQTITYSYVVTNTGNVTLAPITLDDQHTSAAGTSGLAIENAGVIATLAPTQDATLTATYVVTQDDIDQGVLLSNTVTATPTPPTGVTIDPKTDDLTITVADPAPALTVIKTLPNQPTVINDGTPLEFEVTVFNAGNVSLTDVTLTDTLRRANNDLITPAPVAVFDGVDSGMIGTLDVGETWTYTVPYTVTQDDVDAGGISNSVLAKAVDPFDTPTDDVSDTGTGTGSTPTFVAIPAMPAIEGQKTITSSTIAVGETVTFEITITNTGNVTLTSVDVASDMLTRADGAMLPLSSGPSYVSSDKGSPAGTLQVGEVATYRATYVLEQDDIDAGGIENTATVTGTPPTGSPVTDVTDDDGGAGEDDPTVLTIPASRAMSMVKTLASGGPTFSSVGQELVFNFEVTNNSNVTLTDPISITDPTITNQTLTDPSTMSAAIICDPVPLAPMASLDCQGSYYVTLEDLNRGFLTNVASATDGTTSSIDDTVTVPAQQLPELELSKVADPIAPVDFVVGAVATYTYTVTNKGNVTITDPITITDNRIDASGITCDPFPALGIAPDETYECVGTYTVALDDVRLGTVTNNATATDGNVTSPSVSETIPAGGVPALSIDKTLESINGDPAVLAFGEVGDILRYKFVVTNTGNVSFGNDVIVNDPKIRETPLTCFTSAAPVFDLTPTSTAECFGTYEVTQADLDAGEVFNEATAVTEFGTTPIIVQSPADSETTPAAEGPAIDIAKSVATLPVTGVGQDLTYTLTVTNIGNQTLENVVATDILLPNLVCEVDTLARGDTLTCSDVYEVTQADIDNTTRTIVNIASVAAVSTTGQGVSDTTTLSTRTPDPAPRFVMDKTASPDPFGAVGTGITYTFEVENTGTVTLFDVEIRDEIVTPAYVCTVPRLDVGATDNSCTLAYEVTQDDVDAASITNRATATADDPFGTEVGAEDTQITSGPAPEGALVATKTASVGGTTVDSIVTFTLVVENTGNVTLDTVEIDDTMTRANGSPTVLTTPFVLQSGDAAPLGELNVGEVWTYTATYKIGQADLNAGGFENTVEVTALDPSDDTVSDVSDNGDNTDGNTEDDPTVVPIVPGPAINTVKTVLTPATTADNDVVFQITATNVGNVSLTMPTISDTLLRADGGAPTGAVVGPVLTSGNAAGIDPGEAWVWTYTYTLEQDDVDAGGLTNTATAGGTPPTGAPVTDVSDNGTDTDGNTTDDVTPLTILPTPSLNVVKSVVSTGTEPLQLVVFDIVAANDGTVTLFDLELSEDTRNADGTVLTPVDIEVVSGSAARLDVGTSMTYRVSYELSQADIDSGGITNSATVTGTSFTGAVVSDVSHTGSGGGSTPTVAAITQVDTMVATKTASIPTRIAPDLYEVVFTMTVQNTGNVTQTDLVIEDDLRPFLAPATLSSVADLELQGDFTNPSANTAYDGLTIINMLGSDVDLAPQETGQIVLTVRYNTDTGFPAGINTVTATSARISVPATATASVIAGAAPDILASKSVSPATAMLGDVVTYTLSFQNRLATAEANLTLVDALPVGLSYVPDSATYDGAATPAPAEIGRTLQWADVTLAPDEIVTLTVQARVTGGGSTLTNEAYVLDPSGAVVSNVATATLRRPVEPVFECADIIGKVFDDRNMNGSQDGPDGRAYSPITDQDYVGGKFETAPAYEEPGGEPGLANVRLSTVTGTIITTDEFGRFSVPCAELPASIGSNFTLKLDTRSLPSGYQVTTENPRVIRVTPGTMARLNFGATIATVVDIDLMASAFVGNTPDPTDGLLRGVDQLVAALQEQPSVLRLTYYRASETLALAIERMNVLEALIRDKWRGRGGYRLPIERTINRLQ